MSVLICGSMAYDTIMVFHDKFKNHILPDKVHMLNVSFLVPLLRREYGGCAGNIAYSLNMLGEKAHMMATVGHDFEPYAQWLSKCKLTTEFIKILDDHYTAQAYITTDEDDNQLTAFHPGAMSMAYLNTIPTDHPDIAFGIVSPDGKQGMQQHARQFVDAKIPFIFDPGQGAPMFDGNELLEFIEQATWIAVNDYESALLQERTNLSLAEIAQQVEALIITLGGNGSKIYTSGEILHIPAVETKSLLDPTGCGDAYRAGLLYGLIHKLDWNVTGRIASLMGGIKIEHHGTQNHHFTLDGFKKRYQTTFGAEL